MSDPRELMAELWRDAAPATFEAWKELLTNGGKSKVRRPCDVCGRMNEFETPVMDTEEQRHILKFLSENLVAKPKDDGETTRGAGDVLANIHSMSDAELAVLAAPFGEEDSRRWILEHQVRQGVASSGSGSASRSRGSTASGPRSSRSGS